ncbi:hypothetical protein PTKIN_Ptkin11bG0199000 [Pterospermum kingtungense]
MSQENLTLKAIMTLSIMNGFKSRRFDYPSLISVCHWVEYSNFEECVVYLEDCMIKDGPFDGLLALSQGGMLSAMIPSMQRDVFPFFCQRSYRKAKCKGRVTDIAHNNKLSIGL